MTDAQEIQEMLIAPIESEAHYRQVWERLEYARSIGDSPAIVILLAQLAHSKSWRPAKEGRAEAAPAIEKADR